MVHCSTLVTSFDLPQIISFNISEWVAAAAAALFHTSLDLMPYDCVLGYIKCAVHGAPVNAGCCEILKNYGNMRSLFSKQEMVTYGKTSTIQSSQY